MKYIQIPNDGIIEKQIMSGEDLIGVCRIDLSYLPAEDIVPVVHGKWIPFDSQAAGGIHYCSACEVGCTWRPNYCPNCGAKMESE